MISKWLLKLAHVVFYVTVALILLRGKILKWDLGLVSLSFSSAKNLLFFLFGLVLTCWGLTREKIKTPFDRIFILGGIALGLSIVFSRDIIESLSTVGLVLCYVGFFYVSFYMLRTKNQIRSFLILASVISVVICSSNLFYYFSDINQVSRVWIVEDFPFWPGKNMLGLFLVANIAMALGLILKSSIPSLKGKVWLWFVCLLNAAHLLITFSRGAWISMAAIIMVLIFMRPRVLLPLILVGLAALVVFSPFSLKKRILSVGNLKDKNIQERFYIWQSALAMIKDAPLHGVGLGVFYQEYTANYRSPKSRLDWAGEHAHNLYLHIFAETGLLGFLTLLLLFVFILMTGRRSYLDEDDPLLKGVRLGALLAWIGYMVYSLGDSTFNGNFSHASMFHINLCYAILAGFVVRND